MSADSPSVLSHYRQVDRNLNGYILSVMKNSFSFKKFISKHYLVL